MTSLDWAIAGFVVLMALWGYGLGFATSTLALAGFTAGGFAGSRLAPLLLSEGSQSPYAPLVTLLAAVFVGAVGAVFGIELGAGLRGRLGLRAGRKLDGTAGALLLVAIALALAWVAGAVALQTPGLGSARRQIQRSTILAKLNAELPPAGPVLRFLARFDPLPAIHGPETSVGPPSSAILRDPEVRASGNGVVRVLGTACGLSIEGSGWIVRPGVVVTNAHVVAGESDTVVESPDGDRVPAQAIAFVPHDDVAVLSAPGLAGSILATDGSGRSGRSVAILGYPENGPFSAVAGRLGPTGSVVSVDAYGRGPVRRQMTTLRGRVRSGNSGSPVVDARGRVVATVFAGSTTGTPRGFAIPSRTVVRIVASARGTVETGPCTH